jgi:hypothetical protein
MCSAGAGGVLGGPVNSRADGDGATAGEGVGAAVQVQPRYTPPLLPIGEVVKQEGTITTRLNNGVAFDVVPQTPNPGAQPAAIAVTGLPTAQTAIVERNAGGGAGASAAQPPTSAAAAVLAGTNTDLEGLHIINTNIQRCEEFLLAVQQRELDVHNNKVVRCCYSFFGSVFMARGMVEEHA